MRQPDHRAAFIFFRGLIAFSGGLIEFFGMLVWVLDGAYPSWPFTAAGTQQRSPAGN